MPEELEGLSIPQLEQLLGAAQLQDLQPAEAARIEAACLYRLRQRTPPSDRQLILWRVVEAALALFLGGSYLIWNLSQALALYGIQLR